MTAAVFSFDRITDKRHVFNLIDTFRGGPVESTDVLESDAYRAIADDSPWTARLRPRIRNVTRAVYVERPATDWQEEDAGLIGTES